MDTRNDTQRNHLRYTPPKRTGMTPEAKVAKACVAWLEQCGFYVLRTGAGMVTIDGRKVAMGRKGSLDYSCCAPNGRYVSVETKSATGKPTPDQLRQRDFILRRNGVVSIPHSLDELKADLRAAFGDAVVDAWEAAGKERKR